MIRFTLKANTTSLLRMAKTLSVLALVLVCCWCLPALAEEDQPPEEKEAERLFRPWDVITDWSPFGLQIFWKEGLHLHSPQKKVRLKLGGKILYDLGSVQADNSLALLSSVLEGKRDRLRAASIYLVGDFYNRIGFKLEIDFSDVRQIKDNWISYKKLWFIDEITLGHFKEPFSLENGTSRTNLMFLERSLPTEVFSPGRNLGLGFRGTALEKRIVWNGGLFFSTTSYDNISSALDRLNEAVGFNLALRLTGLPVYAEKGRRLVHLGLSYSNHVSYGDNLSQFTTRPESFIARVQLVNTGKFHSSSRHLINTEAALVRGPFSIQAEYFHSFEDTHTNPNFWGYYLAAGFFLTGETRPYNQDRGLFARVKPLKNFKPFKGGWGAVEVVGRLSFIDLNSGRINGGRELNLTAGINWHFNTNLKLMINYVNVTVENSPVGGSGKNRLNIFQARMQVAF